MLSVLEWARERLENSVGIAAMKTGEERVGWLEDVAYWEAIVARLSASEIVDGPPNDVVNRLLLHIRRFRSLGGIPEMCKLSWDLVCENERLKSELATRQKGTVQ